MNSHQHTSVMLSGAIEALNIQPNGLYIDATFGRGGHTQKILSLLTESGKIFAFDQDKTAIEYGKSKFKDSRINFIHRPFSQMESVITQHNLLGKVDGILMDLGVSSPQLDNAQRGFSFNADGMLDMRMNQDTGISAAQWIMGANETEIATVLYQFGEEKRARHIAKAIKIYQKKQPIETTSQLANIISGVVKFSKKKHPATRSFQAIRIFINQELNELEQALLQTPQLLAPKGRLSILSFHSLEDRIVKQFIQKQSKSKPLPKGLPVLQEKLTPMPFINLGKQKPNAIEITHNKRARSAILRIAQKQ
jgi:16S rRNA (cytosine1402-N4)-methyltransferase